MFHQLLDRGQWNETRAYFPFRIYPPEQDHQVKLLASIVRLIHTVNKDGCSLCEVYEERSCSASTIVALSDWNSQLIQKWSKMIMMKYNDEMWEWINKYIKTEIAFFTKFESNLHLFSRFILYLCMSHCFLPFEVHRECDEALSFSFSSCVFSGTLQNYNASDFQRAAQLPAASDRIHGAHIPYTPGQLLVRLYPEDEGSYTL